MGATLVDLIPLMIGTGLVPLWIILVLVLLRGENGLSKAAAFVFGGILVRLLQGIAFGLVFDSAAHGSGGGGTEKSGVVAATLLLVLGLLMWATAVKLFLQEDDPDAPPPRWMGMIAGLSPLKAFAAGAALIVVGAKHWVFTLGAINTIQEYALGQAVAITAYLIYVLGASLLLLAPVLFRAAAPKQSVATLEAAGGWLERNNRPISIGVSVIFGSLFLFKGISGLFA